MAFILYALVYGVDEMMRILPPRLLHALAGVGVLIYAGTGVVTMLLGENFLGYNVLSHDPKHGQEWGIIVVEFGVGLTVASVMMSIFIAFACHNPPIKDEEW